MQASNFFTYLVIAIIIVHFVLGFAYLMVKLSPKKDDKKDKTD